jgi:hypothetical protein
MRQHEQGKREGYELNSETGRAIARMLYAIGFPEHRIGFLFDADHGRVSQVLNSADHKIS